MIRIIRNASYAFFIIIITIHLSTGNQINDGRWETINGFFLPPVVANQLHSQEQVAFLLL